MLRFVPIFLGLLFVFMNFAFANAASAEENSGFRPHVTFNLASFHLNSSRDFNEINPGFGIGITGPSGLGRSEFGIEAGQYRNSLSDQSYYVMSSLDIEVLEISPNVALRMGGFGGFAHYSGSANKFKDHGVPTIGDWVMAVGAQTTLRVADKYDLRLRVMPAGSVADALFTAQISVRY